MCTSQAELWRTCVFPPNKTMRGGHTAAKSRLSRFYAIVDCMWVIGEPISMITVAVERKIGILTEVDTYDCITFLPMSDGTGAYNRHFGRLNTSKMKIRGEMARKGDTPEYINKMQQKVFEILAGARSMGDLQEILRRSGRR